MNKEGIKLYTINTDVECVKCGNIGAVQHYGEWYESGLGSKRDKPFMDYAMGFGGTIPYRCLNCDNVGLIDIVGNFEGYKRAFEKIRQY